MYKNVFNDDIFTSFLVSCEPEVSLLKLKEECYSIKDSFPTKNVSNINGYHSPVFSDVKVCDKEIYPELYKLEDVFLHFSNDYLKLKNYNVTLGEFQWWINISPPHSYNVLHNHKRSDIIGVYYLECDDKNSQLAIIRNDGSQYGNLYSNKPNELKLDIPLIKGRMYIMPGHLFHYVFTNYEKTDRISIAYNLFVNS